MNTAKTELYTSGVDQSETTAISNYGFSSGQLPVRYLGLPLMSRKLKISEYAPLMTKINLSFQSWSVKLLSFAGRLQLLRTIIFGTVTFWTSVFILPKGCIRAIESMCSRFLWSGNIENRGMAKVAWTTVCLPKDEGGLGLRSFLIWNKVLCLKFIWLILSKTPSLWGDWHRSIHLQGRSFWTIRASPSDSWAWRKLLDLRPLALQFCKIQLGNGLSASFWYDVWTLFGQLIEHMGVAGPRALRVRENAVVADAISGSSWTLPHPRSHKEVDLHTHLTTISLPLSPVIEDEYTWDTGNSPLLVFRSDATWERLRPRQAKISWADIVWFKGAIPKLSFNMWIANYDRLPTRSRLQAWGMPISPTCPLCSTLEETRDHLLLTCNFSKAVWKETFIRCHPPLSPLTNWSELLSWIRSAPSSTILLLRKLATQSVIYHLWKQRNNLIHNHVTLPPDRVFQSIDRELRNIISARRHRKRFQSLMLLWLR